MNFKNLLTKFFKKEEPKEEPKNEEPISIPSPLPQETEKEIEIQVSAEDIQEEVSPKEISKKPGTWKTSEQEKQMMVSWHAMGFTPSEIVEKAKDELNISITAMQVYKYTQATKWQPLIKKIRESTMQDLASVAGSHKKVRLQRHEKIYDKAIGKNRFDLAMKATEAQRKEMEEGNISLTLNQFNILSDEDLKAKHEEVLTRIKNLSNKGVLDVVSADKANTTGS